MRAAAARAESWQQEGAGGGGAPAETRQRQVEPAALQEAVEGILLASKPDQAGRKIGK